jgi:hypothetical protein
MDDAMTHRPGIRKLAGRRPDNAVKKKPNRRRGRLCCQAGEARSG